MGREKRDQGYLEAQFTVELSLLMGLILPMLFALVLAGFYVHDQALLQGAACEVAAMGSNLRLEQSRDGMLAQKKDQLVALRLTWGRGVNGMLEGGKERIRVSYHGTFPVPGLMVQLLYEGKLPLGGEWERRIRYPANTIRKIRGVKELIDIVRESSE